MQIDKNGKIVNHTLTLTGSTTALIAAMQAFNEAVGVQDADAGNAPTATETPSTPTGTGSVPAPAPTSAAPTPPAPTPPTAPTSIDDDSEEEGGNETDGSGLDADGLPWDERIHSSNKKQGADGTWHKRRGGPKGDELAAIEAELRAKVGQETAPAAPTPPTAPPPAAPAAPVAPAAPPTPPQVPAAPSAPPPPMPAVDQSATPATPAPAAPAAPVEQQAVPEMDFPTFLQHVGPKFGEGEGQIGAEYLNGLCQQFGLNALTDIGAKPELIPQVVQQLQTDGRW